MDEIDTHRYSRQIGTIGIETMRKLVYMKVLVSGMRGVGVEIAKNLILIGAGTVCVHDNELVAIQDLASNFCLTESDVGTKSRGHASYAKLQGLNPHVNLILHQGTLDETTTKKFNAVVLTEADPASVQRLDAFCRSQSPPIGFISCESWGAFGYAFVDFGDAFTCFDKDGEERDPLFVSKITRGNPGIVTVSSDRRHNFQSGDTVIFREVQGMTELNASDPIPISVLNPFSFSIGDTTCFSEYTREGMVQSVKTPEVLRFDSWEDSVHHPAKTDPLPIVDFSKLGRPEQLHIAMRALRAFQRETGDLPELFNEEHASQVVMLAHQINQHAKENNGLAVDPLEEAVIKKCAVYARAQVSPLATFWGGLVAQEVLKFTGKYMPLKQWLHLDFFEIAQDTASRHLEGTRYDDQIALIGNESQNKLLSQNTLVVGAGTVGCELLKLFAMIGVGCQGGQVTVTDDALVKVSDLDRQFLFREDSIGHNKAEIASIAAYTLNPSLSITSFHERVSSENDSILNQAFWEGLDLVTIAVDNINTRLYVDSQCVWYEKPLLESGIHGTKGSIQVVLPFKTQSYGDCSDCLEAETPLSTVMNFPFTTEHCIEWARRKFHRLFAEAPENFNKYLDNPGEYLAELAQDVYCQQERIEMILEWLALVQEASFEACVRTAREQLQQLFHNWVLQLLHSFPVDYTMTNGEPFWSGHKRTPVPCIYNEENSFHIAFIVSTANLVAASLGIPQNKDVDFIKAIARDIEVKPFNVKNANSIEDEVLARQQSEAALHDVLKGMEKIREDMKTKRLTSVSFEKDGEFNFHIDFIHAASVLRAATYNLPQPDRQTAKMIAGKILPAIATTGALVASLVAVELYKLIIHSDLEAFRNACINSALPMLVLWEPQPPAKNKSKEYDPIVMGPVQAYPEEWTTWDKLLIGGPYTVQQFIEQVLTKYGMDVFALRVENTWIYNEMLPTDQGSSKLGRLLHEVYSESSGKDISGRNSLPVECLCKSDIEISTPLFKYTF